MTDVELRDELMTLLTAGHETTATGLSWAFERLMRTPRVMERLLDSLDDDEYLDAVVKETLRIRPVIMDVARKLTRRHRDRRLHAPRRHAGAAGDRGACTCGPTSTRSPTSSGPSASSTAQPESYAWIPFGGGVRRCIGASFAQVEMRVVLREVLRRVRLQRAVGRARAPARPARDRGAGPRRARGGRPSGCSVPAAAELRRRARLAALLRRAPRDATRPAAPAAPAGAGMAPAPRRRPARAPDLVELALHVPEADRRDQEQQDEDHRPAGGPVRRPRSPGSAEPARSCSTRTRSPGR